MKQMQGIGQLLWKLREKEGIRQKQLCMGISSLSKYARIEADQQEIDFFLIDRIMGRLGKSVERLTYILPMDVYKIYELRQEVQQKICQRKWEEAEQYLDEYEKNKRAKEPLHRQFIEQERAQIEWLRGESVELVCEHLETAILQTMPEAENQRKTGVLSAEEYKLLLFRWEVCQETEQKRAKDEIKALVEEIFRKNFEKTERVKIIPYAALLISKVIEEGENTTYIKMRTEEALEALRDEGKLLYMPEILSQYIRILEKEQSNADFIEILRQEQKCILEVEHDYNVSFENYRLFEHVIRNFEVDAELIRRTRRASKLTQESLSEDICTQETLARIENGNQQPRSEKLWQIMEKMDRNGKRIETGIQVEEYEILELKIEFSKYMHRKEYEKAEKILFEIESKIDRSEPENKQYVEVGKIQLKYHKHLGNSEELVQQLKALLEITLKFEDVYRTEYVLNRQEISVLTEIALIYWGKKDYQMALEIYHFIDDRYSDSCIKPVFHMLDWNMNIANYARALDELKYFKEAMCTCQKAVQQMLYAGKGASLGYCLMIQACIMEEEGKEVCKKYFKQNLNLLKLYKMDADYKVMKNYVEERNLLN